MSYFQYMKSTILVIALVATSFLPAIASAQPASQYQTGAPYSQTTNTTGYQFGFQSSSGGFNTGGGSGGSILGCSGNLCGLANTFLYLINYVAVPVLFAIAFIVFLYGITKAYILSHGESKEVEEGHKLILWGIIGFVVMVSLWGMVNVVANTFGLTGATAPGLPRSY